MDVFNNDVGVRIGAAVPINASEREVADSVKAALDSGQLIITPADSRTEETPAYDFFDGIFGGDTGDSNLGGFFSDIGDFFSDIGSGISDFFSGIGSGISGLFGSAGSGFVAESRESGGYKMVFNPHAGGASGAPYNSGIAGGG